jgi:release factor glutamine methyltransferase
VDSNPTIAHTWGAQRAWAEVVLRAAGSPSPEQDALALLAQAVQATTAALTAQPEHPLTAEEVARFASWVARRADGEPIAYLTGHLAFMGLELMVDRRVPLVRPGAQGLVEATLEVVRSRPPGTVLAAEIGTGCGAIALALAAFEPGITHIYAVDKSAAALEVARANGARYLMNVLISWLEGDLLEPVPEPVDLLVADLLGHRAASANSNEQGDFQRLIAQAPAKLRLGSTLVLALDLAERTAAEESLARSLPDAFISSGSTIPGGDQVVVVQLPR